MVQDNRCRFNVRKLMILDFVARYTIPEVYAERFDHGKPWKAVTPEDLYCTMANITPENARRRLWKLYVEGYLRRTKRGTYKMKKKGIRVWKKLRTLNEASKLLNMPVSLNIRKSIPTEFREAYRQKTGRSLVL